MNQLVRVTEVRSLTPSVKAFAFARFDKKPLLPFKAGAHLELPLADAASGFSATRSFSLTSDPDGLERYEIAVLLEEQGGGGSAFMHESVQEGRAFNIGQPVESFGLSESAEHHLLVAGGIGITPFISMAKTLVKDGASFELHYLGRDLSFMPFVDELTALCGSRLTTYGTRVSGRTRPPLDDVLKSYRRDNHVYVCGPSVLNFDVLKTAKSKGWPDEQVHCESFSGKAGAEDQTFLVHLARQNRKLEVVPGVSILDSILRAGVQVPYDCKHGTCGACTTAVIEGKPLHKDAAYSDPANATDEFIRICVSRARTDRLVLDI